MSIELKEAAQQVLKELGEARKIVRASSSRQLAKDWDRRATDALANLRIAIQQPEPVVPDNSEHLRVIASLGAALRQLSFAAQTTGGTNGPDAELQSAIGQAEQALSLGGIWQAMSATGEPVDFPAGAIVNGRTLMDRIEAYPFESEGGDLRMCSDWHELRRCFEHLADYVSPRPAPSVLKDDQIAALVNKVRDIAHMFHDHQSLRERIAIELVPALKASQEVKSNAERYRWLREQNESLESFTFYVGCDNGPDDDGSVEWVGADLDAAIDAAKKEPT